MNDNITEAAKIVGLTPVEYRAVIGTDVRRARQIVRDRELIETSEHPVAVAVALIRGNA